MVRYWNRDLDRTAGVGAQEFNVTDLHGMAPPDLANDTRHYGRRAAAADRFAGIVEIEAVESVGEAVRIADAPDLAVGDDIQPGVFLVADGEQGGVILSLLPPL